LLWFWVVAEVDVWHGFGSGYAEVQVSTPARRS
jgi:hypothetical protein